MDWIFNKVHLVSHFDIFMAGVAGAVGAMFGAWLFRRD